MARGANSNKRKADQGSGSSLKFSVKVPRRGVKKEHVKIEPGVTVKKEEGTDKSYAPSESGTPSEYIVKIECFKPANPNGATMTERSKPIRVNNGQRILTVRSTDSIEDFLNRMMPEVQRDIGGLPADWTIQVKVEGDEAELFKDFTLLELDGGESTEDEDTTQWLWRMFLAELSAALPGSGPAAAKGSVHVTLKASSPIAQASNDGQKGKGKAGKGNGDIVNGAGPKLVTKGQSDKHICLDFTARAVWAMAWDRGETGVTLQVPHSIPPFIAPPAATTTSATIPRSAAGPSSTAPTAINAQPQPPFAIEVIDDDDIIKCSSSDDGFEILAPLLAPKIPVPVKKEVGLSSVQMKQEAGPSNARSVLGSAENQKRSNSNAAPAAPSVGRRMRLGAWCRQYEITQAAHQKLVNFGVTTPFAVARMTFDHFKSAGLTEGDRLTIQVALECWVADGKEPRPEVKTDMKEEVANPGEEPAANDIAANDKENNRNGAAEDVDVGAAALLQLYAAMKPATA